MTDEIKTKRDIPVTVCYANLSPGEVRQELLDSLGGVFMFHAERNENPIRATVVINSGPRVAEGRSQIVDQFAQSGCEWLWMVDSDMTFPPDALHRLLRIVYEIDDAFIAGGLCFGGRAERPMFPTIYELIELDGLPMTKIVYDYPKDAIVKVGATGAAFMLIHKSVFAGMKRAFGKLPDGKTNPYPWFVEAGNAGRPFGEDIAFCLKAQAMGMPIYIDTGCRIGHIKTWEMNEEKYDQQQALAGRTVMEVIERHDRLEAQVKHLKKQLVSSKLEESSLTLP